MQNLQIEGGIKKIIKEEMETFVKKIIDEQILEFQDKLAQKATEIISKVVEYIIVTQNDDVAGLRTVIQIEFNKVVIIGGNK